MHAETVKYHQKPSSRYTIFHNENGIHLQPLNFDGFAFDKKAAEMK